MVGFYSRSRPNRHPRNKAVYRITTCAHFKYCELALQLWLVQNQLDHQPPNNIPEVEDPTCSVNSSSWLDWEG